MSVSFLEVSKSALSKNVRAFRQMISPQTFLMAVVKANAYGHGLGLVSRAIENQVDWFGVDNFEEARLLRENGGKKPILVLGYMPTDKLDEAIRLDISFVVYRGDILAEVARIARKVSKKAKVHVEIETGLNRQGVEGKELVHLAKVLRRLEKQVTVEGTYTHFADVEEMGSRFAKEQMRRFEESIEIFKKSGIDPGIRHSAATAAVILLPETRLDMARVGIGIYGLWPSKEVRLAAQRKVTLVPVLSWKTQVVQVKEVRVGESVGYSRTWQVKRPSRIAVLPVGYSDGYDRGLSNKGKVLIQGCFAPVVGRVAMNMFMVDVTDISDVRVDDEVLLVGRQGKKEVTADDLANLLGTINYEVVARLNPAIPRTLVE